VFTVVTVFAAGVESIQKWWLELGAPGITPAQAISVKTVSLLAAVMLLLSAIITIDAVRRWVLILSGARTVAVELKPAANVGGN
jgi:dolichyl-phosphate-mannose--protein O-mannosyl transferase